MAKKKSKLRIYLIISFIVIFLGGLIAFVVMSGSDNTINVTTSLVERRTIVQTVSAIGKIQPETEVKISSETSGEVIYLGVQEGDSVRTNQLLSRIKPDIIETQLEQYRSAAEASKMDIESSKAEKERSESDLKRITDLYKKEYSSKQEFEQAKSTFERAESAYRASLSRYDQAMSALKQIQRSADRTTIFSPINGIVTKLGIEKGEKVLGTAQFQGTEMMVISDLTVMNAMVDVDENDIVLVKLGDTAKVEIDAISDKYLTGTVIEIGHSAVVSSVGTQDQVTNFKVKVRIVDRENRLRPGMSCNVEIQTEKHQNVLAVPLQAVTVREDQLNSKPDVEKRGIQKIEQPEAKTPSKRPPSVVFMLNKGFAKMVTIKTGISDKGFIEVIDGLKEKDVVISGSYLAVSKELKDGIKVKNDSLGKKKFDSDKK